MNSWFLCAALYILMGLCCGASEEDEYIDFDKAEGLSTRVIGGVPDSNNNFPFVVRIEIPQPNEQMARVCSGVLFRRNVLTAAHCINGMASATVVIPGIRNRSQRRITVQASEFRVHSGFNAARRENNIAMILIPGNEIRGVPSLNQFQPPRRQRNYVNEAFLISGFGLAQTTDDSSYPNTLQYGLATVIADNDCREPLAAIDSEYTLTNSVCIRTTGPRLCTGDEGGALIDNRRGKIRILLGIATVTSAIDCNDQNSINVFLLIENYREWILTTGRERIRRT